ncbi:RNA polymerases M/15 Kd subunit family protein [Saccharomyces cerevisiae]|nr:RNA polymerases M/15 Kd subunit family protein [Saccharomyces cerevisiae]
MTTFRFCRDCNNMLYPREDKENNRLLFECRTCSYVEEAGSPLVYRHELITNIGETAGVVQDIGSDPLFRDLIENVPNVTLGRMCFFSHNKEERILRWFYSLCAYLAHTYLLQIKKTKGRSFHECSTNFQN